MQRLKLQLISIIALGSLLILSGCGDDDSGSGSTPTGNTKTYTLSNVAIADISGTATFTEMSDGSTVIELKLANTPSGGLHPARIHRNSAAESGPIAITLGTIEGDTGESIITVSALDNGTPISYEELIQFDGYINVLLSDSNISTLIAQGDIGENELTGTSSLYTLSSVSDLTIFGSLSFKERVNGETLATIIVENTKVGITYPAQLRFNTVAEGGDVIFSFNPIEGASGFSNTNISELDDRSPITYNELTDFSGHVNIYVNNTDIANIVAQADIGQNALTGMSEYYPLSEKDITGISGTAVFSERINSTTLITLMLENTPGDGIHPAHIHDNDAVTGGPIAISLSSVDGMSGMSYTQVSQTDGGEQITYDDLITYDGYINVHLSEQDLATIVAQGNVGSNVE